MIVLNKILKSLAEWVVIIAIAFVLSIVIRNYLVDTRIVPTGSMIPTIQLQDRLIVDRFFYKHNPIERGDIVVFSAPVAAAEDKDLVKRVIGLPGEKLEIKSGTVFINDRMLAEPYIENPADYDYGPVDIPDDSFFMLGDNRKYSKDSHVWGYVPAENLLGKVWIRYWPIERLGHLTQAPEEYFADAGKK